MYSMLILILISISISLVLILLVTILKMNKNFNNEKSSSFECGFDMMSMSRLPFSIHFFLICIIFLIFDVEICLILPLICSKFSSLKMYWILTLILFLVILTWGLLHEWHFESLQWKMNL